MLDTPHRFPGRELREAELPVGLRAAWEWSSSQTLRHVVMATDTWLGQAILEQEWEHHRYAVRDLDVLAGTRF